MKKILAAFLLIVLSATSSFAAAQGAAAVLGASTANAGNQIFPQNASAQEGPSVGKLSTGVYFAWATLTTSYIIKTQHTSGTKIFATASDSTAINWKPTVNDAKGGDLVAPPAGATNSDLINEGGWSVM
jgi:hypothetical protein